MWAVGCGLAGVGGVQLAVGRRPAGRGEHRECGELDSSRAHYKRLVDADRRARVVAAVRGAATVAVATGRHVMVSIMILVAVMIG